jgi:hypothetical protein
MKNFISIIICSGFIWSAVAQELDAPVNANETEKKDSVAVVKDTSNLKNIAGPESSGSAATKMADTSRIISSKEVDTDKDTIDGSVLLSKIAGIKNSIVKNISKSRMQGYGGGAIVGPVIMGMKMKPIYDLTRRDSDLRGHNFINFDPGYSPILMSGAIGYGGVGNGTRIGFGGYNGSFYIGSEGVNKDSLLVLKVSMSYGGLFLEKVKVHENWNILGGGILGGGAIKVKKGFQSSSAFSKLNDPDAESDADAVFLGLELHGGCTYTIFPWFHLGADVNSLFMMSVNGWGTLANTTFATANPGVRIRIVFGNLG